MDEVTLLRALERILAVLVGGISVYLGYRLFLKIPEQRGGEAKIEFPGNLSVYIARVGPGAFFALFGATIVGLAIFKGVTYYKESPNGDSEKPILAPSHTVYYGGLNPGERSPEAGQDELSRRRLEQAIGIEFLNTLTPETLARDETTRAHVTDIKLSLMELVWGPDWGSYDEFRIWAEAGASDPVPPLLRASVIYFRRGLEARP